MKVTFRCKQSGNTVSFIDENDIEIMRKEPEYEEIKNGNEEKANAARIEESNAGNSSSGKDEENVVKRDGIKKEEVLKKRGRPSKTDFVI